MNLKFKTVTIRLDAGLKRDMDEFLKEKNASGAPRWTQEYFIGEALKEKLIAETTKKAMK